MFTQSQIEEIVDLLYTLNKETKIYIGTDSVRFKKNNRKYARFATVVVIHKNGKNGCRVFMAKSEEIDFDVKKNRPSIRLMNEVQKSCEAYIQLAPFIDEFDVEIHLDISKNPMNGSNCVATQAAGYVLGVTGLSEKQIKLKPDSPAATFCGDHGARGIMEEKDI